MGAAFKDAQKSVKRLEIRRVTGAGCYYREIQLLTQHERDTGDLAGTKAIIVLHRCLSFAVSFMRALDKAVQENTKFQLKKRLQTYKVRNYVNLTIIHL